MNTQTENGPPETTWFFGAVYGRADGLGEVPRHQTMLTTAFDAAEDITFDAIKQEHQSS
jgi:hypothetical protein